MVADALIMQYFVLNDCHSIATMDLDSECQSIQGAVVN